MRMLKYRRQCEIKTEIFDENTLKAVKQCILGLTTKEVVTEYGVDEETGKLKILKQKVNETMQKR